MDNFSHESGSTGIENELARQRCVARDEFVTTLADRVEGRSRQAHRRRVGGFLALTGVALVALGASGGGIYAASSSPAKKVSGVHLNQTGKIQRPDSSSHAQYGPVPVPPHPKPRPPAPQPPPAPPPPPFKPPGQSGGPGSGSGGSSSGGTSGGGQSSGGSQSSGGGQTAGATAGGTQGSNQGSGLPFTGFSLFIPVVVGGALIGVGLVLRRRGRATVE